MKRQPTANALTALEARYLRKGEEGQLVESPEEMFRRVARAIAAAERRFTGEREAEAAEERFFHLLSSLVFLPNSPTLMNAGTELGQLVRLLRAAGGRFPAGDFQYLARRCPHPPERRRNRILLFPPAPGGRPGAQHQGISSGPVSFMRVFDAATEAIRQGGTRRGANMGILRVDHPDILSFIRCKDREGDLTNFNISVAATDGFMAALRRGEDFSLVNPRSGAEAGRLSAAEVFAALAGQAWKNGEPGIVFIDTINDEHPAAHLGAIEATNPCGEQPLLPCEACTLGSLNLKLLADGRGRIDYPRSEGGGALGGAFP